MQEQTGDVGVLLSERKINEILKIEGVRDVGEYADRLLKAGIISRDVFYTLLDINQTRLVGDSLGFNDELIAKISKLYDLIEDRRIIFGVNDLLKKAYEDKKRFEE